MQFKSLGEQIEFYLNPSHLDLWMLQKSLQTMIDRYYRAKLTSHTLFQLQSTINEIEELCEIIRLISNKKATKQKDGIGRLKDLLNTRKEHQYLNYSELVCNNSDKINELSDSMTYSNIWYGFARCLQRVFREHFEKCQRNYEFQKIIKISSTGFTEAWEFLNGRITILTAVVGVLLYVVTLLEKNAYINELKNNHLVTVFKSIEASDQVELLKSLFVVLFIFVVVTTLYVSLIVKETSLILDKNKARSISLQDSGKFIFTKIRNQMLLLFVCSVVIFSLINLGTFNFSNSCQMYFIIVSIIIVTCFITMFEVKKFLYELFSIPLILFPMLFPIMWVLRNSNSIQVVDYFLLTEMLAVPLIFIIFIDMTFYNLTSKIILSVVVYLVASWAIVSQYINYLEFLGLRNAPNVISLLKVEMIQPSLTGKLHDMGFLQLKYNGNESQASDLLFEQYIFTRGIESTIYFSSISESQPIHLFELESYVMSNKNTICDSKLSRAILSEFEDGSESRHYFGYDGCNANVNSFKTNEKIKLVNKLFLVHQFESNYTYWIFGAHVNWKKPDALVISAAKNDDLNTITLNKDRGMSYYSETPFSIFTNPENLRDFSLTKYGKIVHGLLK